MTLTNQLYHTSIKIGEDAQTQIDFETANEIHFDADNTERVKIDSTGLNIVSGSLETATIDYTDGDLAMTIADGGGVTFAQTVNLSASTDLQFNSTAILSDSAGTMTLSNIDALDATTESTIEAAIDTLANLTSAASLSTVGTIGTGTWQGTAIDSTYIADAFIKNDADDASTGTITAAGFTVSEDGKIDFSNTAPGTSGDATGLIFSFTAGATLAVGDVVYMGTGGKVLLSDANATTSMPALGICTSASTDTNPVDVMVQGLMKLTGWSFTVGADIFISGTAGDVTATAPSASGDTVQKVGVAVASDTVYFNFNTTELVLA